MLRWILRKMAEMTFLTKKRLLYFLGFTFMFIFFTIIFKSHWSYTRQLAKQEEEIKKKAKKASSCDSYTALTRCERCPRDELNKLVSYCMETGFKEYIRCDDGKEEYIWCDVSPAIEEADFWKFQFFMLMLGLSSYAVVYLRQQKLDKLLMEKINKQISADA